MPSGHAQSVGVFATFLTMHLLLGPRPGPCANSCTRRKGGDARWGVRAAAVVMAWAIAAAVCVQRTHACHTPAQVAAGLAVGVLVGAGGYAAFRCVCRGAARGS